MDIEKAQESLRAAEICFAQHLYNSTANRAYYAMFQAAVVALDKAGMKPMRDYWAHDTLQSMFSRELTRNRKTYPRKFATYLADALIIRNLADYRQVMVSVPQARSVLKWAQEFVTAVVGAEE